MCRRLLNNDHVLRDIVEDHRQSSLLLFADALEALNDLRLSCFGKTLADDFEAKILQFKDCYLKLKISMTTTVHVIFNHIIGQI